MEIEFEKMKRRSNIIETSQNRKKIQTIDGLDWTCICRKNTYQNTQLSLKEAHLLAVEQKPPSSEEEEEEELGVRRAKGFHSFTVDLRNLRTCSVNSLQMALKKES